MNRRVKTALVVGFAFVCVVFLAPGVGSASGGAAAPKQATVAFGTRVVTLDPDLAFYPPDLGALHLIGGNLYELRGDGKAVPGLASGYSVASNGLTQTYTLRSKLKFSNGSPLAARDVVATIERSIHNKSNGYAGFFAPIVSVAAPGPQTVVFKLSRPYPSLPTILAEPPFAILPATAFNPSTGAAKAHVFDQPISAGPYKLQSWGGGPTMTFVLNPLYVGPKPLIPLVRFVTIQDYNARANQLRSGQIDLVNALPPALVPTLASASGIRVVPDASYGWQTLGMWNEKGPLKDPRVRRAISLAINRDQLSQTAFFGKVPTIAAFWPSTMTGHDSSLSMKPDVAQAKQLLAKTPCAKGCTFQLVFETDDQPWSEQAAVIIQSNLQAIGIKTQLVHLDAQTLVSRLSAGKYQLSVYGLYDFANVPDGMLAYGLLKTGGLNANFTGYHSVQMDKLAKDATESSGARRQTALQQINTLFSRDQPFATFSDYVNIYATRLPQSLIWVDGGQFVQIGRQK